MWAVRKSSGFTIVELLLVVVIIAVLAAVVVVAYNGITTRAKVSKVYQDMTNVNKLIQTYHTLNGQYPVTSPTMGSGATSLSDANCTSMGTGTAQWVPGLTTTLPQSDQSLKGTGNGNGCYVYLSNGTDYLLSAWNVLPTPSTSAGYRRLGFRETGWYSANYYVCNHTNIGGGATYNVNNDYYKRSVTYTSITSCVETPPSGA